MAGLWDFGDVVEPLEDSSEEEDSKIEYDELSCLPPQKRKKIEQLRKKNPHLELIDLDDEEHAWDKPVRQGSKSTKPKIAPESDSDLDLEFIPMAKRPREAAAVDPVILQNQAMLRRFQEAAQEPEIDDLTAGKDSTCAAESVEPAVQRPLGHAQPAAKRSRGQASVQNQDSDAESEVESDCDDELEADKRVVLKLQCSDGTLHLRTRTQNALSSLFAVFKVQAKGKGWIQDTQIPMKFVFEGDPLTGNETADSLDLEGDEIIEVQW